MHNGQIEDLSEFANFLDGSEPVALVETHDEKAIERLLIKRSGHEKEIYVWTLRSGFMLRGAYTEISRFEEHKPHPNEMNVIIEPIDVEENELGALLVLGNTSRDGYILRYFVPESDYDELSERDIARIKKEVISNYKSEWEEFQNRREIGDSENRDKIVSEIISICLEKGDENCVFVIKDIHRFLSKEMGPQFISLVVRAIKDLNDTLFSYKNGMKVILLGHFTEIPEDLRDSIVFITHPGVNDHEMGQIVDEFIKDSKKKKLRKAEKSKLVASLVGLSIDQAHRVLRSSFDSNGRITDDAIQNIDNEKRKVIRASGVLDYFPMQSIPDIEAGGLSRFDEWLDVRKKSFEEREEAQKFGISRLPRGVLLLGISGTGKSLSAKLVAKKWKIPLLRLDLGMIMDKWVGSSEARIRSALSLAETISPCVLWIDEIEKAFGGRDSGGGLKSDSITANILATLLVWLQEHSKAVFTVATSNNIDALPPELLRAGRFDKNFFIGLPGTSARETILNIHLSKMNLRIGAKQLESLVEETHGLTGAEIEQGIVDAMYEGFSRGSRPTRDALVESLGRTTPIVSSMGRNMRTIWEKLEDGSVEPAGNDFLDDEQVEDLIDPPTYASLYCYKRSIEGLSIEYFRAESILESQLARRKSMCLFRLKYGTWIYGQCNFIDDSRSKFALKFTEKFEDITLGGVVQKLAMESGLEQILFYEDDLYEQVINDRSLRQFSDICQLLPEEQVKNLKSYVKRVRKKLRKSENDNFIYANHG